MFFAKESNRKILNEFLKKEFSRDVADKTMKMRLEASEQVIQSMYNVSEKWDEKCKFNIKSIGHNLINHINAFDHKDQLQIDWIYAYIYRFLCEFEFMIKKGYELDQYLSRTKSQIEHDESAMDSRVHWNIQYAQTTMLGHIFKDMISSEDVDLYRHVIKTLEEAKTHKEQWDKELESKNSQLEAQKAEVEKLRDNLREQEHGFNFVGLDKGFSNLSKQKTKEAFWLFCSLFVMGIILTLPLIASIFPSILMFLGINTILDSTNWITFLPIMSMEVILIYFFRIILINHRSVKAQIIQIELRKTLCQFIQSYVKYSSKIQEKDKATLEKFEKLIFSGILSNPENIPSTFDGMEQISKLLKESRGKP